MPKAAKNNVSKKTDGASTSEPEAEAPKRYGSWHFVKKLGSGTFGNVELWKHLISDQAIAVKRLIPASDPANQKKYQSDFNYEKSTLSSMDHPNIIRLISLPRIMRFPEPAYGMEYSATGSLFRFMSRYLYVGGMPNFYATKVMRDIAAGLKYLHSQKYAHRDLKPENILVLEHNGGQINCKLIDFGSVHFFLDETSYSTAKVGTTGYCAPEMYLRTGYQIPIDYWPLGCTFHYVLTGHIPFTSPSKGIEKIEWSRVMINNKNFDHICGHARSMADLDIKFYDRIIFPIDLSTKMENQLTEWFRIALHKDHYRRGRDPKSNEFVLYSKLETILYHQSFLLVSFNSYESCYFDVNEQTTLQDLKNFILENLHVTIESQFIMDSEGNDIENYIKINEGLMKKFQKCLLYVINKDQKIGHTCKVLKKPSLLEFYLQFPQSVKNTPYEVKKSYSTLIFWMRYELRFLETFIDGLNLYTLLADSQVKLFHAKFLKYCDNLKASTVEYDEYASVHHRIILTINCEIHAANRVIQSITSMDRVKKCQSIKNRLGELLEAYKALCNAPEKCNTPLETSKIAFAMLSFQSDHFYIMKDPNLFATLQISRRILALINSLDSVLTEYSTEEKNVWNESETFFIALGTILDNFHTDMKLIENIKNQAIVQLL